jgi:protein ERP2
VLISPNANYFYRTKTFEDGDHKICFDNTFSIFSAKTVFFEISTDNDEDDDDNGEIKIEKKNSDVWGDTDQAFYAGLRPEEIYDIHVQDIKVLNINFLSSKSIEFKN